MFDKLKNYENSNYVRDRRISAPINIDVAGVR